MSAQTYATENIRNIALVGHSDTGKTSLVSAMLFASGTVNRLCKVDDGNTTTDFDDDEIERKITINTSVAHLEHNSVKLNLIDTPGYSIFTTEALPEPGFRLLATGRFAHHPDYVAATAQESGLVLDSQARETLRLQSDHAVSGYVHVLRKPG